MDRLDMKLEKNDTIECPKCHTSMLKCLDPPKQDETNYTHKFEPIEYTEKGAYPICPKCKTFWQTNEGVYVKGKGWVW